MSPQEISELQELITHIATAIEDGSVTNEQVARMGELLMKWITDSQIDTTLFVRLPALKDAIEALDTFVVKSDISDFATEDQLVSISHNLNDISLQLQDLVATLANYATKTDVQSVAASLGSTVDSLSSRLNTVVSSITAMGIKTITADADTIKQTGRYLMQTGSGNLYGTGPHYVEVLAASDSFIVQRAVSAENVNSQRVYNGSTWSEWL